MKKIILIITLCFSLSNINAQSSQYSGVYQQSPNPGDVVTNTAITNYVSGSMLRIDTYHDLGSGGSYFVLTFIDDQFNPTAASIKYDGPNYEDLTINNVKFDVVNNCYIACGYAYYNGYQNGILINFDNYGNIVWKISGWDNNNLYGAKEYRRVEIIESPFGGTIYAACGWGTNQTSYNTYHGEIGFYDVNGNLLSMYIPSNLWGNNSKYMDLVYNPLNQHLVVVGQCYDMDILVGYVYQEYDFTQNPPSAINPLFFKNYDQTDVTSIAFDPTISPDGGYYLTGSSLYGYVYCWKVDANLTTTLFENSYTFSNITFPVVSDISFNTITNGIGITGYCTTSNGIEGFVFDIDQNGDFDNSNYKFSVWSGYNYPGLPSNVYNTCFKNITMRENNASPLPYSYILNGKPVNPDREFSYIAEYYPDPSMVLSNCTNIFEFGINSPYPYINLDNKNSFYEQALDLLPLFIQSQVQLDININCENPLFNNIFNERKISTLNSTFKNENGIIYLDENYKNSIWKVYSSDGKLVMSKGKNISILNTNELIPGLYFIQADSLKTIKISVIH